MYNTYARTHRMREHRCQDSTSRKSLNICTWSSASYTVIEKLLYIIKGHMQVIIGLLSETWGLLLYEELYIHYTKLSFTYSRKHTFYFVCLAQGTPSFFFYLVWLVGPLNSWPPGRRPLSVGLHISHHAPNKYDRERKLLWWMRLVMMQDIRSDWGDALDDKKDWNESFKPSSGSLILTIGTFSWQRCWQQSISFNRLEVSTFFILYISIK